MEKLESPRLEVTATRDHVEITFAGLVRVRLQHDEAQWIRDAIEDEIEAAFTPPE